MQKKTVITFGSHGSYIEAGKRLIQQAKHCKLFHQHLLYTPLHLQGEFLKHRPFIQANPRGYGYWIWKPYIIQQTMQTMKDGDVLLYVDCGCELDIQKRTQLNAMMKLVEMELLIGTYTKHNEQTYTKSDLVDRMKLPTISSPQHQAGALLFLVCPKTRHLVDEWYELCCDYPNIDDSPSILPNVPQFIEHRHDQSVFSLLTKKYNLFSLYTLDHCVYYIRNRTGESKLTNTGMKHLSMAQMIKDAMS